MSRYLEELEGYSSEEDDYDQDAEEWSIDEQRRQLYGREDDESEDLDGLEQVEDLVDHYNSHSMISVGDQKRIVPKKKKKDDEENRIIIVQVEDEKSKDEMNWDSVYTKLASRKLNKMKFTMKDIESHKLHYDKVDTSRFEVSKMEDDDDEEEENTQKKKKERNYFEQKVIKTGVDLSLGKMAGCAHGSLVFLSGGGKSGKVYSQLLCYEVKEKKWVDMKETMFNYYRKHGMNDILFPPASDNHIIFIMGEYLVWYDFKVTCLALKNYLELVKPTPANKIDKSDPPTPRWVHIDIMTITKAIRETSGYSMSKSNFEQKFWSFGGRDISGGSLTNQLVEYTFNRKTFYSRVHGNVIEFDLARDLANIANPKAIPLPRENHAQCTVGNAIYIFGGNYSQKDNLLNDLHRFDITTRKWSEIDMTFIPPPMRNHSLCNCIDQYIYLTGGILRGNTISDILYRYDVKANEFAVVNPGGPSEYVLYGNGITTPRDLQLPRAEHTTLYDQGQLFMIGGMTDFGKRKYCKEAVVLKECLDIGVENSSYHYLKNQFEKQTNGDLDGYDLILKVAERSTGETEYIYVHKCLVSSRSAYFRDLLGGNGIEMVDGKSIVELTSYHLDTMNIFIRFLYTGDIIIPDTVGTECLQELLNISKMDIDRYEIILSVCDQKRLYLDSSTAVLNQLKHDCSALYHQIEETMDNFVREPCDENHYADITIQILEPNTGELLNELRAHKLFICKSNYISTVFSSGMEETTTGTIKFDEISLNGLLSVLKYLYTNEIVVSIEHAVEVFICSLLFQLNELANYCRTIVIQHITPDNVLELSYLVDVYNDLALKNSCIKCISQNFDTLSKLDGFEHLSSEIKGEARTRHFEMVKKLTKSRAKERMKVKK